MTADRERLQQTFGGPHVAWIIRRLRHRLEAGLDIQKKLTLREPSPLQRETLARLFGRRMPRSGPVTVRASDLEALIRHAKLADSLVDAIEALSGAIEDKAGKRSEEDRAWTSIFSNMESLLRESPIALHWVAELRDSGLIRRLAKHDLDRGRLLCAQALEIARRLPTSGAYLTEIAAIGAGDGHALDPGRPLSAILLRLVSNLSGIEDWRTIEGRRSAWAGAGVLVDELSAPVLTLNLRSEGNSSLDRALSLHAGIGEPYRITTRQLLRGGFIFTKSSVGPRVYVCENPTVVAAAANALGAASAPLICIEGQPKTPAHILLLQLRRAGVELAYHGDFDWAGIQIANLIIQRYQAIPWRFCAVDYENSAAGTALKGKTVTSCWDPDLTAMMIRHQSAIHEEALLPLLLRDLRATADSTVLQPPVSMGDLSSKA